MIIFKKACKRCNHSWLPRTEKDPVLCPKCHSPYWNIERKRRKKNGVL